MAPPPFWNPSAAGWMSGSSILATFKKLQRPAPFFPEVHAEVTKMWHALYSACADSLLTSINGANAQRYSKYGRGPPPIRKVKRGQGVCRWMSGQTDT